MASAGVRCQILVTDLPPKVSDDDLLYYFESARAGHDLEVEGVELSVDCTVAIVTFSDEDDVQQVLQRSHNLKKCKLKVRRLEEHETLSSVLEAKTSQKKIPRQISQIDIPQKKGHSALYKSPSSPQLSPRSKQPPQSYSSSTSSHHSRPRRVIKVETVPEQPKVEPKVELVPERPLTPPSPTPEISHLSQDEGSEDDKYDDAMDHVYEEPVEHTSAIADTDENKDKTEERYTEPFTEEKFRVLTLMFEEIQRKFPQLQMFANEPALKVKLICPVGTAEEVELHILSLAGNMESLRLTDVNTEVVRLVISGGNKKMAEYFEKNNIKAHLYLSGNIPYVIAQNSEQVQDAVNCVNDAFTVVELQLDDRQAMFFNSYDGSRFKRKLEEKHLVLCELDENKNMRLQGLESDAENAKRDILEELGNYTEIGVILEVECKAKWNLIDRFYRDVLERCLDVPNRPKANVGQIREKPSGKVEVSINGLQDSGTEAKKQIEENLLHDIMAEHRTLDKTGLKVGMFKERHGAGRVGLEMIENTNRCIIEVSEQTDDGDSDGSGSYADIDEDIYEELSDYDDSDDDDDNDSSNLIVDKGDISSFKADVLVNTVSTRGNDLTKMGQISNTFVKAGGDEFNKAFGEQIKDAGLKEAQIVVTKATNSLTANCQHVLHLAMKPWRPEGSQGILRKMIRDCITEAQKLGAKSIAFPTLGSGRLRFPDVEIAEAFVDVFYQMGLYNGDMKVFVVVYGERPFNNYKAMMERKTAEVKRTAATGNIQERPLPPPPSFKLSSLQSKVVFTIYTRGDGSVGHVTKEIEELVERMLYEKEVNVGRLMADFSQENIKDIHKLCGDKVAVEFDDKKQVIILKGEQNNVLRVEHELKTKIQDIEAAINDPNYVMAQKGVSPEYLEALAKEDVKIPSEWKHYQHKTLRSVLRAKKEVKLSDLDTKTDQAVKNLIHQTWDNANYRVGGGYDAKNLAGYTRIEVQAIKRIENPQLYQNYTNKRSEILLKAAKKVPQSIPQLGACTESEVITKQKNIAELDGVLIPQINEYFLLHGTKVEVKDGIMKQGLDFRLAAHGGLFGRGIYFAESSAKADQYADARDSRKAVGELMYMLVVRVTLGNIHLMDQIGKEPTKLYKPPCMVCPPTECENCNKHNEPYDSVLGVTNGKQRMIFREFVLYDKSQCYPEFLVEYKRVK